MDLATRKQQFESWRTGRRTAAVTRFYLDAYLANLDAPPALREAHAHAARYDHMELVMLPDARLAGLSNVREPVRFDYGGGTQVDEPLVAELAAHDARIVEEVAAVRDRTYRGGDLDLYTPAERNAIQCGAATSTWFGGHMAPDYERLLAIGLDGYAADIAAARRNNPGRDDLYDALDIMLRAISRLIERTAAAGPDELADVLKPIAHDPPATFHQALQLVWMIHGLFGADSFGRLDVVLDPFYRADVAAGRLDDSRAEALIAELLLHIEAAGSIQNMTLGGVDADGNDFYTPLTRMILRVTRRMGYKGPNLCLRVTPTMPQEVWDEALATIASGIGLPALYNDGLYTQSLTRSGVPLPEARNYCFGGCSQVMLPGRCNFVNDIGLFNVAKVAELTMYGGFDPRTNTQAGPVTPPATACGSFDELLDAFYAQLGYFIDVEASIHRKELAHRASREGYVLRTLLTRDCIARGLGVFQGGARFHNVELELIGITNAADHLYGVKKAVFDDRRYTMEQLTAGLRSDFQGPGLEAMRLYLLNHVPKFGNDIAEVDRLRAEIAGRLYAGFNAQPGPLGGVFVPGEVIFVTHASCGRQTGATADGRRAGTVLADSAGAAQGRDRNGPTALMNSVLRLPASDHLLTTVVLNLRFLPSMFEPPASRRSVRSLLAGFFGRGGMQVQINVCDTDLLRQAQANPDAHSSLVVRVGGYSDYFVRLPRVLQDEIMNRTAQVGC